MNKASIIFVLHTHLPWVLSHDTWPHGEEWLYEAMAECYIPLLNASNRLYNQCIPINLNIDISPILCEQLANDRTKVKFVEYCKAKISSAEFDFFRFTRQNEHPHKIFLSNYWKEYYQNALNDFTLNYDCDIVGALRSLQDKNAIEIMTCGLTHGYLPLLGFDASINTQIEAAVENYNKYFGRNPKGIWLPECAYRKSYEWKSEIPVKPFNHKHLRPGIEQFLSKYGIEYFISDELNLFESEFLGLKNSKHDNYFLNKSDIDYSYKPSTFKSYVAASSGELSYGSSNVFFRNKDLAMKVWSGQSGYPADGAFLDFHKKQDTSMLKYWKVTGTKVDMGDKELYYPEDIKSILFKQAKDFTSQIENSIKDYDKSKVTICLPFDTELFGHWWFEGIDFLEEFIKSVNGSELIEMQKASIALESKWNNEVIVLKESSWGENNNHDVWMNEDTKWFWEEIYNSELRFSKYMLSDNYKTDKILERYLLQAYKELLLMQSSDWEFLVTTKSARDYAEKRFSFHLSDFNKVCNYIDNYFINQEFTEESQKELQYLETINCIFPELKLSSWKGL